MQFRGSSLPLVQLADAAGVQPVTLEGDLAVVVTAVAGHDVGILGMMPVSVVESQAKVDTQTHRQQGICGSAIIAGKTVLMLDIFEVIDAVHPEWRAKKDSDKTKTAEEKSAVVLLAEDSDFFRGQVAKYIEEAGFEVIAGKDGYDAWELLETNAGRVRVVVTDIEMPRMNGLDLCRKIRNDTRFVNLPVIALTSLAGEEDAARGKDAGIDDYQIKMDRDRLIEGLNRALSRN